MKAIFIDTKHKTIAEIELLNPNSTAKGWDLDAEQFDRMAALLESSSIEAGLYLGEDQRLMIAKDAPIEYFFTFGAFPFYGNGIVIGVNGYGEYCSNSLTLDEIKSKVRFDF